MWTDVLIRFLVGGAIVSAFAVLGEIVHPKTFAGLFGSAPSVALATLALTFGKGHANEVQAEGVPMVLGAAAFLAYAALCVACTKREGWPVWLSAGLAWLAWFAVAFGLLRSAEGAGVLG
ncbi:MAG TPA: hypothetical protein VGG39_33635 [Polyangiaceae bacterium]|jgi:hypothetical protein